MLAESRRSQLEPVLSALREIEGLEGIGDDDFNSTEIDIWMYVKGREAADRRYWNFDRPLRQVKAQVKSVLNRLGVSWRWTDYPEMKYEYIPVAHRFGGPAKEKLGYDQQRMGVSVVII
jgi:hypothetical protein